MQLFDSHKFVVRWSSYSHYTVIRQSYIGHQVVIRWSSDGHQTVIRRSSDSHQTDIRQSSDGHQKVIRRSSGSHQTVTRQNHQWIIFCLCFRLKGFLVLLFVSTYFLFPLIWIQNLKPQFWNKSCVQIPSVHLQSVHFIRIYTIAAAHNCLELHSQ